MLTTQHVTIAAGISELQHPKLECHQEEDFKLRDEDVGPTSLWCALLDTILEPAWAGCRKLPVLVYKPRSHPTCTGEMVIRKVTLHLTSTHSCFGLILQLCPCIWSFALIWYCGVDQTNIIWATWSMAYLKRPWSILLCLLSHTLQFKSKTCSPLLALQSPNHGLCFIHKIAS